MRPWYRKRGWVLALLLFVPPLGIPLLWWGKHFPHRVRIALTVASTLLFVAVVGGGKRDKDKAAAAPPSPAALPSKSDSPSNVQAEVPAAERIDPETGDAVAEKPKAAEAAAAVPPPLGDPKARFRAMHDELEELLRIGKGKMAALRGRIERAKQDGGSDLDALRSCGEMMRANQPRAEPIGPETVQLQQYMNRTGGNGYPFGLLRVAAMEMDACVSCLSTAKRACPAAEKALRDARRALKD